MLKKIVIIGPESTGKSTLCEQLSAHYHTPWCPEYAREYLLKHGMNYTYNDLLTIAKGQIALEEKVVQSAAASRQPIDSHFSVFIDTDMYVMKVWCEFVFGKCHPFILEQIAERKYDHYLLCNIDLPWVKDELREYPDIERRQQLYSIYKNILTDQPVPWTEISGSPDKRLAKAINTVDKLLEKQ